MKRLAVIVCFAMLMSCNYFDKRKIDTKEILDEELKSINWNDVDEYPTFSICDASPDKKICFEDFLRNKLNENLLKQNIVITEDVNDTVILKIHIDKEGNFSIKDVKSSEVIETQIPKLDSILRHSFDSLPQIHPAIKRGQQVATEFNLPVIVNSN